MPLMKELRVPTPESEVISPWIRRRYLLHGKVYKYELCFSKKILQCSSANTQRAHTQKEDESMTSADLQIMP